MKNDTFIIKFVGLCCMFTISSGHQIIADIDSLALVLNVQNIGSVEQYHILYRKEIYTFSMYSKNRAYYINYV